MAHYVLVLEGNITSSGLVLEGNIYWEERLGWAKCF